MRTYWAAKRPQETESTLKATIAIDAKNITANRALGVFYMATGRGAEAEPYFQTIAATANTPDAMMTLAQYYIISKRPKDARRVLTELATQPASYAAASTRLAALDAAENNRAEALIRVRGVLAKYPNDVPAQLLNANLLYLDHKNDEALAAVNAAITVNPNLAAAHLMAGRFYASGGRPDDASVARAGAETGAAIDRRGAGLARLNLLKGAIDRSLTYAQQVLTAQPDNAEARNLLVRSYVSRGDVPKARGFSPP